MDIRDFSDIIIIIFYGVGSISNALELYIFCRPLSSINDSFVIIFVIFVKFIVIQGDSKLRCESKTR